MKTLNRCLVVFAVLVACGAAFVGWHSLQLRLERTKLELDPEAFARVRVAGYLVPVITNFYFSNVIAPTMSYERNKQLLISTVTNQWPDFATEQLPPRYQHRDDLRCYLFPPPKLESNTHSIILLAALATNAVPSFWVAMSHHNGNFEVFSIKGYSQQWLGTLMSRKPDMYFLTMRGAYLMHQAEGKSAPKTP